jgi:hypothetical protein
MFLWNGELRNTFGLVDGTVPGMERYIGKTTNIYDRRLGALCVALDLCFDHRRMDGVYAIGSWAIPWMAGVAILATCN